MILKSVCNWEANCDSQQLQVWVFELCLTNLGSHLLQVTSLLPVLYLTRLLGIALEGSNMPCTGDSGPSHPTNYMFCVYHDQIETEREITKM